MERTPTAPAIDKEKIDTVGTGIKQTIAHKSHDTGEYLRKLGVLTASTNASGKRVPEQVPGSDGAVEAHLDQLNGAERRELAKILGKEEREGKKLAKGQENLRLDPSKEGTGVLGTARLKEGEESVSLNTQVVTDFNTNAGKEMYTNVTAHELSHALDQDAIGTVYAGNTVVTTFDQVEDKSERAGARALGKGNDYRRPGQPPEYAKAQENAQKVRQMGVKEEDMDAAIKEGDTEGLQQLILEESIRNGQLSLEQLGEQLQSNHDAMFQHAASTVLFDHLLEEQRRQQQNSQATVAMAS